jgi:hypothetical protein
VSESAVRAKRGGGWFGAQPARSEGPSEPRPSGVHTKKGAVERKDAKQLRGPLEGWDHGAARTVGCSYRMNSSSDATGGA